MFCIQLGMRLCEFRMRRLERRVIPLQRLNLIVELYEKRLNIGERTTTCDEGVDSIDQFSERVHSDDQITPDAEYQNQVAATPDLTLPLLRFRSFRCLPQDFAKFFSGGCHVALCRAGDADGRRFRRAREWAVEQAFASYELEDRDRQSDAASGLHFSDQRTHAVAFHRAMRGLA
jgi:hypothetical protein